MISGFFSSFCIHLKAFPSTLISSLFFSYFLSSMFDFNFKNKELFLALSFSSLSECLLISVLYLRFLVLIVGSRETLSGEFFLRFTFLRCKSSIFGFCRCYFDFFRDLFSLILTIRLIQRGVENPIKVGRSSMCLCINLLFSLSCYAVS